MLILYLSFVDDEKDKTRFEQLYYTYRKRMLSAAFAILADKQEAEDVVHETFIKIAKNISSISEVESQKTLSYVLKATKNTAINLNNKNKKRKNESDFIEVSDISDDDFFEKLDIENRYNFVVSEIMKLDEKYKDVLFYRFVCDMKSGKIADVLGRKESTVKQQLVRGKKILLDKLKENQEWLCE